MNPHRISQMKTAAITWILLSHGSTGYGIVRRHDVSDDLYRVSADAYPALVTIGGSHGTLVSNQWVLTAAHTVDSKSPDRSTVTINGQKRSIVRIVLHESWLGSGMPGVGMPDWVDLAMLMLDEPVRDVIPIPLYRNANETGQIVTLVGRGRTGDGTTGGETSDGALRHSRNRIDQVEDDWILMTFDAPPGGELLEGISGPGDSGGPAILTVDGEPFLAGVSSRNDDHGLGQCRYGTTERYARVSSHLDWIDQVVNRNSTVGLFQDLSAVGWPDTPIAEAAARFFDALATGNRQRLETFEATTGDPTRAAKQADAWMRLVSVGALTSIDRIAVLNSSNIVVTATFENTRREFRFGFDMTDTSQLRAIRVGRIGPINQLEK